MSEKQVSPEDNVRRNVMGPVEWGLLLLLSTLWGGSFFFIEVALDDLPPFTLVLSRVALGALALNLVVLASGRRMPRSMTLWGAFLAMGALNNLIPFSLISWGQTQIDSGLAAILNAATPLFTVVIAHMLTADERLTPHRAIGIVVGLAGVVTMIGLGALESVSVHVVAELAVICAALSYASAGIFGRRFRGIPPLMVAAGQLTATTSMMIPLTLVADRPWTLQTPAITTWAAVIALALLSTALAYVIYFRILAAAGATNLVLVTFLIPVTALLLGTTILGESLSVQHVMGMALIGAGLAGIDGRLPAALRRRLSRPVVELDTGETG